MSSNGSDESGWYLNRQRNVRFDERELEMFLVQLKQRVAKGREFAVVIGSDDSLRQANTRFRGLRATTDVLSFPDGADGRLGDILISAVRAGRQADEFGHSVEDELKILALHGVLHLLGYDHENDGVRMLNAETRWRKKLDLPAGLVERARPSRVARPQC